MLEPQPPQPLGALALARARLGSPAHPGRWLLTLRWGALAGMFITTRVAAALVPGVQLSGASRVLAGAAVVNLLCELLGPRLGTDTPRGVTVQIAADVGVLTAVLWQSGGVGNPFACFLVFQIVLAGLLATRGGLFLITGLTVLAVLLLARAPALDLSTAAMGAPTLASLSTAVSLVALGLVTALFVYVFLRRVDGFRDASAKAEKLAALGRTVGALSHELNTPLGTIHLAGRELVAVGEELRHEEIRRLATTVVGEAQRASDVIGLLRGYVRPDARRESVDVCRFVPPYVHQELDRMRFDGERVLRVCAPMEGEVLRAALCQVLTNVLQNAVDAMRALPQQRLEVEVQDGGRVVEVCVRDNGPGMSARVLQTLGEPFTTTKAEQGGTGLGLYVSNLLAERMGATLAVESHPGQGTAVTLSLHKPSGAAGARS